MLNVQDWTEMTYAVGCAWTWSLSPFHETRQISTESHNPNFQHLISH